MQTEVIYGSSSHRASVSTIYFSEAIQELCTSDVLMLNTYSNSDKDSDDVHEVL